MTIKVETVGRSQNFNYIICEKCRIGEGMLVDYSVAKNLYKEKKLQTNQFSKR